MLELYRGEPVADTLKLMICLGELGLHAETHHVDVAALEQWSEAHRRLAPQGQVPVLIDDGEVMNDSGFALQYLAEAYPEGKLAPADPWLWYETQAWLGQMEASIGPALAPLGWTSTTPPDTRAAYRAKLAAIPGREKPAGWAAVFSDAEATEDQVVNARERIAGAVGRLEERLADADWIVGGAYTIADIGTFALTHTLPRLLPDIVNEAKTPRMTAWLARVGAREAVIAALAMRPGGGEQDDYAPPN